MKYNQKNIPLLMDSLKKAYPEATCSLDFDTPFHLLVAVMLSAQCTDERVNKTTPSLFSVYDTPSDFANANLERLQSLIHPCGFYKVKSKNLIACSKMIIQNFSGQVPENMEDLVKLPGIGRKCANVIMLNAFSNPVRHCC